MAGSPYYSKFTSYNTQTKSICSAEICTPWIYCRYSYCNFQDPLLGIADIRNSFLSASIRVSYSLFLCYGKYPLSLNSKLNPIEESALVFPPTMALPLYKQELFLTRYSPCFFLEEMISWSGGWSSVSTHFILCVCAVDVFWLRSSECRPPDIRPPLWILIFLLAVCRTSHRSTESTVEILLWSRLM